MDNTNLKDLLFKLLWTLLPVAVGIVLAAVADWQPALAGAAAMVVQAVSAYARQKLGATPPDIQGLPANAVIEAKVVSTSEA